MDNNKLKKEIIRLKRAERKMLARKERDTADSGMGMLARRTAEAVPEKARNFAAAVFASGFDYIFSLGEDIIEKTINDKKLMQGFMERGQSGGLAKLAARGRLSGAAEAGISGVKSFVFGMAGIGAPDIPVYIAQLIRLVYKTSLRFGFDYREEGEKLFVLAVICTAFSAGEKRLEYSRLCDDIGRALNDGRPAPCELAELTDAASQLVFKRAGPVKLLQGVIIIGALGSVGDARLYMELAEAASIKYEKRRLMAECGSGRN